MSASQACSILVAMDFSASSDAALDYAWFLAGRVGGTIDLVHVWDPCMAAQEGERGLFADTTAGLAMIDLLASRERRGSVEIRARVEVGDFCEAIVRIAQSQRFDLLVMGPEGKNDSFADAVARRVDCPVVRATWKNEPSGDATA